MWREGLAKGASSTGKDLCRVDLRIRVFLPPESYGFHVVDFTQKRVLQNPFVFTFSDHEKLSLHH